MRLPFPLEDDKNVQDLIDFAVPWVRRHAPYNGNSYLNEIAINLILATLGYQDTLQDFMHSLPGLRGAHWAQVLRWAEPGAQ